MKHRLAQEWTREHDRYFWRFTWARERGQRWNWAAVLVSADDERQKCHLRFTGFGRSLLIALPNIVKPHCRRVQPAGWDAATIKRLGRDYYDVLTQCEYGISLFNGSHLSIHYGVQSHDSRSEKSWGCFLPWTQWRHVRHSLYDLNGAHFADMPEHRRMMDTWGWRKALENGCPTAVFVFKDFDGEEIEATTRIEEREWRWGERQWKWLSLFRRPKISRSLDIQFGKETGPRKGSWKGGTIGHSIEMLPGELHEAAFRRYCAENGMTFGGLLAPSS